MNRRLEIMKNTILKRTLRGSLKNWVLNTFSPTCEILANRKIEYVKPNESGNFLAVKLKGEPVVMKISQSIGLKALQHVIAEQFYTWQWHYYEIPETMVAQGDIVFDCGSAEGIFCLLTYKRAKHIYAFEPLAEYVDSIKATFGDIPNVEFVNEALGDKVDTVYFVRGGIASFITNEKTDTVVNLNTMDNFCKERGCRVDFIKADIEGYEQQLLEGGKDSITLYKPKIAITVYHRENNMEEIIRYLRSLVPEYKFKTKGISEYPQNPVMLHAWV